MNSSFIQRVKNAENEAFTEMSAATCDSLVRYANRISNGSRNVSLDPESAVQSAFFSFWKGLKEQQFDFDDRQSLRAILYMLVKRKVIKRIRGLLAEKRGRGEQPASIDHALSDGQASEPRSDSLGPAAMAEALEEVDRLLALLPSDQMRKVVLLKTEGRSDQETAEILNVARVTVVRKLQLIRSIWIEDAAASIK